MVGRFGSWNSYLWEPGGTVLRNLYGERDGAALARRDYRETQRRERMILTGRVEVRSIVIWPTRLGRSAKTWQLLDRDQFARHAARTFAYVNTGHPFREGNGRTAKLFMQHVAELSRWQIDYSPAVCGVTPEMWNQASMLSHPDRFQYEPVPDSLVPVFRAMTQPRSAAGPPPGPSAGQTGGSTAAR